MPPGLVLWLTLISSNYPCLEHISWFQGCSTYKTDCHLHLPLMWWPPLYSSYLQECDKGCEVLCIYNWLKKTCLRHQSIISVNFKAEGEPENRELVFNTYSRNSSSTHIPSPQKGGRRVLIIRFLSKVKLLLVSFRMISAKETSSGTK